jgi:signal transduction histidine kinase
MSVGVSTAPLATAPTPDHGLERFAQPAIAIGIAVVAMVIIAIGDYITGIELPFTILYLFPIAIATWVGNRRTGAMLAAAAVASMAASLVHEGLGSFPIAWNLVGSGALLLASTWTIDRMRAYVERERGLRRMAVDQLRHAERLNVIGTLAAGVAHELGTPLNVIAGCAELLGEAADDGCIDKRRTHMILDQVEKISGIIRRLLDFGRRSDPTRARVELGELASEATKMLTSTAQKRGASIVLERGSEVHVKASAAELEQVLSNLILNALQAMERGTVRVKTGITLRGEEKVAFVSVEDRGCGIPPEYLERIFEPFFTTKGVGEGTGLGLAVSYGIVRDHHGWIEVTSEPGEGSRFTVILPLVQ